MAVMLKDLVQETEGSVSFWQETAEKVGMDA